ncbi:hypothetical protein R1flu_012491 [Riccia fluitans]|uniref:Uncharacterized protein n=1 Tax=Riccia fluitans TaxID=41844 RepID=A0ABD1ZBX7_9MARC
MMVMENLTGDDESPHFHLLVLANMDQRVLDTMIPLARILMIPNLQHVVTIGSCSIADVSVDSCHTSEMPSDDHVLDRVEVIPIVAPSNMLQTPVVDECVIGLDGADPAWITQAGTHIVTPPLT